MQTSTAALTFIMKKQDGAKIRRSKSKLFVYVSPLSLQVLHRRIYQFQLLLRGAGQLLYIFQYLPGLKLRQLLYQLLLCLL